MDFDGQTFDKDRDGKRLTQQHVMVTSIMKDGNWHTLHSISATTGFPEASISARIRDFRKSRFGAHNVMRRYVNNGVWEYSIPSLRND